MIALKNLDRIKKISLCSERVLDLGGGRHPLPYATHVVDLEPYDSKIRLDPITKEKPRFDKSTWVIHDVCKDKLPFEDKFFEFCFCSHLLEDIRDPISVCKEMIRVSNAGYIEVPSRQREIFSKARFFSLKSLLGKMPEIGFHHHRWFVDVEGNKITFTAKDGRLYLDKGRFITRFNLGRKLNEEESATFLFWENDFDFEEHYFQDANELNKYRNEALAKLKSFK